MWREVRECVSVRIYIFLQPSSRKWAMYICIKLLMSIGKIVFPIDDQQPSLICLPHCSYDGEEKLRITKKKHEKTREEKTKHTRHGRTNHHSMYDTVLISIHFIFNISANIMIMISVQSVSFLLLLLVGWLVGWLILAHTQYNIYATHT